METNKITIWSLAGNAVLVLMVLLLLRGHGCMHTATDVAVSKTSDTIVRYTDRTDTMYRTITAYIPHVERVIVTQRDTLFSVKSAAPLCSDTVLYADSIYRAREFKAIITDIVTANRIARRSIQWADLTPVTDRTVTNNTTLEKQQALLKVYLGAAAGVRYAEPLTRGGLDIAPALSVVVADRYMLDAGYYILGGEISAGLKVKLSFHK
ncbi:MAG: hypothetical protein JST76_14025 [Bacteroidetes bacterium]|nr:hypothetical protein [Bacteroidota bacterium]